MTTKYGGSKVLLACTSFLAFAGLTAVVAARAPTNTDAAPPVEGQAVRRVVVEDGRVFVPVERAPVQRVPVARTRGS